MVFRYLDRNLKSLIQMLVKTNAGTVQGVDSIPITIEVNVGGHVVGGKIGYYFVGLPDNAVKEGYQRIESAIRTLGRTMPRQKIVVNMAPANIRKEGSSYDLPIAIGILASSRQLNADSLDKYLMMGELALDGELRPIRGALPIAIMARKQGIQKIILPRQNAREAAIVDQIEVYGVSTLREVYDILQGISKPEPVTRFNFPRQPHDDHLAMSDYFASVESGQMDVVALQVVTVGQAATEKFDALQAAGDYSEGYFTHGLSVQTAEATANYLHQHILRELGLPEGQGKRYSWGYPAIPELEDHRKVFDLLPVEKELGMSLSAAYQLIPEQSTAAIIVHHPQAKYYSVGESRVEQLMRS